MTSRLDHLARSRSALTDRADFALGAVQVSPSSLSLTGSLGTSRIEPQMMRVLVQLSERRGTTVSREDLVARSWNGVPVGNDSINRAIAGIRRAERAVAKGAFSIETVSGAGYKLLVDREATSTSNDADAAVSEALDRGWQSWRLGLPAVDADAIAALRAAEQAAPTRADIPGMLALLLREAAEYAHENDCLALVGECETAARRALALDPGEETARTALDTLAPIFGNWIARRRSLEESLSKNPENVSALHAMSMLEMTTGRPSAALPIMRALVETDPFAATFQYKLIYQSWATGHLAEAMRVADTAIQLWPTHPAIWMSRFSLLAFTGAVEAARRLLTDTPMRRAMPPQMIVAREKLLDALEDRVQTDTAVRANLALARLGPAATVAALNHLAGLGAVDEFYLVAEGYYLNRGPFGGIVGRTVSDPSITDQHRRITQLLFTPNMNCVRADPRFSRLCDDIGLTDYWTQTGLEPDYLSAAR